MKNASLVHHPLIGPMIQYAIEQGVSKDSLIGITKLDPLQLNTADYRMKPDQLKQLIHLIVSKTGDNCLGLHVGESIRGGNLGILGFAMMNCATFKEALEKFTIYYQLVGNITRFYARLHKDQVHYYWLFVNRNLWDVRIPILQGLAACINPLVYELTNHTLPILSAHFSWDQPDNITEYQRIFGDRLFFGQPYTTVVFEKKYLSLPLKSPNSELLLMFEKHTREKYSNIFSNRLYTHEVMKLLNRFPQEAITINEVSKKLKLTIRNLQLKLKEEGTTFSQLKDRTLCDHAISFLLSGISASEVGTRLGFSEPSAFYRTFKRWTGKTPKEYCLQ